MSRVYVQMDTIQNVHEPSGGIHVPPSGECDECSIFEGRLEEVELAVQGKISAPASASNGDFLVYKDGSWTAKSLSVWQGGSY